MTITFNCLHCGQEFDVEAARAGETGPCAACGESLTVPDPNNRFAGAAASDQFRFKRGWFSLLFGIWMVLIVVGMLIPKVSSTGRRNYTAGCSNNLWQLGIAMQAHHEAKKHLPSAARAPRTGQPSAAGSHHAVGYGWTVSLLLYLNEDALYQELTSAQGRWQYADPSTRAELATTVLSVLICLEPPGFGRVDTNLSEYQAVQTPKGKLPPARSTYVAIPSSHFANNVGFGQLFESASASSHFDGNGAIPFPKAQSKAPPESAWEENIAAWKFSRGLKLQDITDGTSKTVMLCETREQGYAAWIDGQATWVVGAWPGTAGAPTETGATDGDLGWPDRDTKGRVTLGLDPIANPQEFYLSAKQFGSRYDRLWGPSSDHPGGVVNHVFVDGHVRSIKPDIDRNLYLRMISRDGYELTHPDKLLHAFQ